MKLHNQSLGPKAITTTDRGVVVLQPGQSDNLNVSDDDAAAIKRHKLLDAPDGSQGRSIADLQREIASAVPAPLTPTPAEPDADANLPAEDDAEVIALRDSVNATELQKIATDEKVDMEGAKNKTDAARRIVAKRRAAAAAGGGQQPENEDTLPGADDPEVVALVNDNDEDALRQIAGDETVAVTSDDDKTDLARKIVAARRAE